MTTIQLMWDRSYAPACYIIARQRLDGTFEARDEVNTVLVHTNWDYPGVAQRSDGAWQARTATTPGPMGRLLVPSAAEQRRT
jgi:hypothetical protein